jgi:hypothetical protein
MNYTDSISMCKTFKQLVSILLSIILFTVSISFTSTPTVLASPLSQLNDIRQQVQRAIPNPDISQQIQTLKALVPELSNLDISQQLQSLKQSLPEIPSVDISQQLQSLKQSLPKLPNVDVSQQLQALKQSIPDLKIKEQIGNFQQAIAGIDLEKFRSTITKVDLTKEAKKLQEALAKVDLSQQSEQLKVIAHIISNQKLIQTAQKFLTISPDNFCDAYYDYKQGIDNSAWIAIQEGAGPLYAVITSISTASAAGAGNLAGYAGIASAVSQLGLGPLTTTIAGLLGSNVYGAAATAVVTSAVGGPAVMTALIVGGIAATSVGTYQVTKFATTRLNYYAEAYCNPPQSE